VEILLRLCWALPLVLLAGLAIMLLLKRVVVTPGAKDRHRRLSLCESLTVSDEMRVHLIEVDGGAYLVTESARRSAIQVAAARTGQAGRGQVGGAVPWARILRRTAS
jgi:flagellar biogenesis protein FliO